MNHPTIHEVRVECLDGSSATFPCRADEWMLGAMRRAGVRAVTVGCRGGGCGVCKVEVVSGSVLRGPMSRTHVTEAEEQAGFGLLCRLRPESDVVVRALDVRLAAPALFGGGLAARGAGATGPTG